MAKQRSRVGEENSDTLVTMNNLAIECDHADRVDESIRLLRKVVEIQRKKFGPDHFELLVAQSNLAWFLSKAGRLEEALPLQEDATKRFTKLMGWDHLTSINLLNGLTVMQLKAGRFHEALPNSELTYELSVKNIGADAPETLIKRLNCAAAYDGVGRRDQAVSVWESLLRAAGRKKSPIDPTYIRKLLVLAYERSHDFARAARMHGELADIAQRSASVDKTMLADERLQQGCCLLKRGDSKQLDKAERVLRESLRLREQLTTEAWLPSYTRTRIAAAMLESVRVRPAENGEKLREAEKLLLDSYAAMFSQASKFPEVHDHMRETCEVLIKLYEFTGNVDKADRWRGTRRGFGCEQAPTPRMQQP